MIANNSKNQSIIKYSFIFLSIFCTSLLIADQPVYNVRRQFSDECGLCLAEAIPSNNLGSEGITKIYLINDEHDSLVHTYNWYSDQIYLLVYMGKISIIRFGPLRPRGFKADNKTLCIGFYCNGKELKTYSTISISLDEDNIERSINQYQIIKKILGFETYKNYKNRYKTVFKIITIDDRLITFDINNGKIID